MRKVTTLVANLSNTDEKFDESIENLELYPERYTLISRETWVDQASGNMMEMVRFLDNGEPPPSSGLK